MITRSLPSDQDPEHEKGKEALERVKTKLLTEGDASSGKFDY